MLKMHNLENCINAAVENNAKFIGVGIKLPNLEKEEVIINPIENAKKKLEYYKSSYTEDLKLISFNEIMITKFTYGDSLESIQEDLF